MLKKFLINKKGAEKYLSIWWFFVLTVIGIGIVIGVAVYFFADVDVRAFEAESLATKIADCLIQNGKINQEIFSNSSFDIFKACGLSKEIISGGSYFLKIEIFDYGDCKVENEKIVCLNTKTIPSYNNKAIIFGDPRAEVQCELQGEHYLLCSEKYIYTLNKNGEKLMLHILAGSNQLKSSK